MFKFLKKKKQETDIEIIKEETQEKEEESKSEKYIRDEVRIREGANEEFKVMEEKEQRLKRQDSEWMIYGIVVVFLVILVAVATYLALIWNLLSEKDLPVKSNQPSITQIAENKKLVETKNENENPISENISENKEEKIPENQTPAVSQPAVAPDQIPVKVLNGGAAPGTAGKVRDLLNSKGYTKATAANASQETYTGQTVFFQDGNEAAATAIKDLMKAQYPKMEVKTASSVEEKSAAIVVMMGK